MRQKYPVRPGNNPCHVQRPDSARPIDSEILKNYRVRIFACALLSVSQPVAGYPDLAETLGNDATGVKQASDNRLTAPLCKPGCITVIDYLNAGTHLELSRAYNAVRPAHAEIPAHWRHRYEIRLTRRNDDRIVFDHHGFQHLFTSNHDGTFSPADSTSGTLLLRGEQHIWIDSRAIQHGFHGSFLTTLRFPDNQTLTLHYRSGKLHTVSDEKSGTMTFVQDNAYLSEVQLPDGQVLPYATDPCTNLPQPTRDPMPDDSGTTGSAEGEPPPERCDTQENPAPGFAGIVPRPGTSTLDARPASCQSYFVEFHGTVRGEQIEAGLEDHPPYSAMVPTNRSFPIIDFINGNELIVVRSRDVASPSYNNPQAPDSLFDRLMRDAQQIQTRALDRLESEGVLSGTENGRTTLITQSDLHEVSLHLLIRHNMASAAHWQQIEEARIALATRYGFQLRVVIIP